MRESQIGDTFQPSGDTPREAPDTGEIVYAAGHSVRTRRWVWRQAGDALVTAGTRDVLFPVDGFAGATDEPVRQAVEMLATACRDLFGATVTTGMVTAGSATFNDRL